MPCCASGQSYIVSLPELDFEIGNDGLPLQLNVDSGTPMLSIEWGFTLAIGFDEVSG